MPSTGTITEAEHHLPEKGECSSHKGDADMERGFCLDGYLDGKMF